MSELLVQTKFELRKFLNEQIKFGFHGPKLIKSLDNVIVGKKCIYHVKMLVNESSTSTILKKAL